ncbi:MAG: DUF6273 domain-containing protein [Coriobacteriia bacterium]|nr:DUF6273 domain-containing protein [Coriobacteriia bacterium]
MRCKKCGAELPDGARFCFMCASPVEADATGAADGARQDAAAAEQAVDDAVDAQAEEDAPADVTAGGDDAAADPVADGAMTDAGAEGEPAASDIAQRMGAMPAPVKLEGSVPVGAVPFVPMAPAPRGAYLQRRAAPVRSGRPGANSAPTSASGYSTSGWPQGSAWSLEGRMPEDPQKMIERRNESDDPIGSIKTKFKGVFDSWGSNSSARGEKKRQEREAREAATRVEHEEETRRAREQQEKARREREDREVAALREAYAASKRAKAPAAEQGAPAEAAAGTVDDAAAASEQAAVSAERVAAPAEEQTVLSTERPAAAQDAVVEAPSAETSAIPGEVARPCVDEALLAADLGATQVAAPVHDPALSEASYPADGPAPLSASSDDISALWGADEDEGAAPAADDDFGEASTRDLSAAAALLDEEPVGAAAQASSGFFAAERGARARSASSSRTKVNPAVAIVAAIVVVAVVAGFAFAHALGGSQDTPDPVLKPSQDETAVEEPAAEEPEATEPESTEPEVRSTVEEYSWDELSQIAEMISAAASDSSGLEIAKKYNLCAADGRLDGTQAKTLVADGVTVRMRIAGFRHDAKADGSGLAGITFISDTSVATREMNTGSGADWGATTLRSWLNGDFVATLPEELQAKLVSVAKTTNSFSSAGAQETTQDKVWVASYSELVGELDSSCDRYSTYQSEGAQYQLFSDMGISWHEPGEVLIVQGDCANWWTRSPDPVNSGLFIAPRNSDGYPGYARNPALTGEIGVVPAFCL